MRLPLPQGASSFYDYVAGGAASKGFNMNSESGVNRLKKMCGASLKKCKHKVQEKRMDADNHVVLVGKPVWRPIVDKFELAYRKNDAPVEFCSTRAPNDRCELVAAMDRRCRVYYREKEVDDPADASKKLRMRFFCNNPKDGTNARTCLDDPAFTRWTWNKVKLTKVSTCAHRESRTRNILIHAPVRCCLPNSGDASRCRWFGSNTREIEKSDMLPCGEDYPVGGDSNRAPTRGESMYASNALSRLSMRLTGQSAKQLEITDPEFVMMAHTGIENKIIREEDDGGVDAFLLAGQKKEQLQQAVAKSGTLYFQRPASGAAIEYQQTIVVRLLPPAPSASARPSMATLIPSVFLQVRLMWMKSVRRCSHPLRARAQPAPCGSRLMMQRS